MTLPGGAQPAFALGFSEQGEGFARAGVVKDAGDDPDVTHGALVLACVRAGEPGQGVVFRAGEGVGTVTRPGLPVAVGEPAINPVPRAMMRQALSEENGGAEPDLIVEIGIRHGEELAKKTLNGRLGIVGGLSVLGTTGIVVPFSCAAWIHAIHRGVDVARASGLTHLLAATGDTSEKAGQAYYGLPEMALIEMGDFAGGFLKYVRAHPVARVTVAGGFAKMTKLAQGLLDLHSKRGAVDFGFLAQLAADGSGEAALCAAIAQANSAMEAEALARAARLDLAGLVGRRALETVRVALGDAPVQAEVMVVSRTGDVLALVR